MSNYRIDELQRYADTFRAISNPHRLHIFLYLARACAPGEQSTPEEMRASVGELADQLEIAPSTVSHHLKELRQAGLIRMERRGRYVDCWVEPDTLVTLSSFFLEAGSE